ncbi:restriction endonuclease subunit S [Pseudomonas sp. HLT2-19-2]
MSQSEASMVPQIRFFGFEDQWKEVKLGEVANLINGRAYSQDELLKSGFYKVLRVGNFYTNSSWYFSDMQLAEKYYANNGDLLYTWSASFGPHIWEGEKVIFHYHIWKIDLSETLVKEFALQLLEKDKEKILNNSNGSTMIHITKGGMEVKEFSIPSPKEQTQIGSYFQELDQLIQQHQHKHDKLVTLKQAMLQKMFPQPGTTMPEIRFKEFKGEWVEKKLGELMPITSAARVHKHEWTRSGVPFFRTSDVVSLYKGEENAKAFISLDLYEKLSDKIGRIKRGDILITGGGSIGIPFLAKSDDPLYFKDADLLWLKVPEGIDSIYLYTFFSSTRFREYLGSISHIGTIGHYTIEQAKKTPIAIPLQAEQQKIGTYFRQLDELISRHATQLEKLKQVKGACLQKMFI